MCIWNTSSEPKMFSHPACDISWIQRSRCQSQISRLTSWIENASCIHKPWSDQVGRRVEISPNQPCRAMSWYHEAQNHITSHHITHDTVTCHHITHSHVTSRRKENTKKKFLGRPQTAMNNSVKVFWVHEQGREAADHSADVNKYDQYDTTVHMSEATQCYHNMKKRTQRRSSSAAQTHRNTHHCISPRQHHTVTSHHITHPSHLTTSHIAPYHTSQAERREHKEQVLVPSSWAGCWRAEHQT